MWVYVKTLQRPINLKSNDLRMAKYLITQYGGPDGELSASLRYLNQRYTMPTRKTKGLLNDIGTEEMAHVEMIATMVYQLMDNACIEDIKKAGLAGHYADHGKATFYTDATGNAPHYKMRISGKKDNLGSVLNFLVNYTQSDLFSVQSPCISSLYLLLSSTSISSPYCSLSALHNCL